MFISIAKNKDLEFPRKKLKGDDQILFTSSGYEIDMKSNIELNDIGNLTEVEFKNWLIDICGLKKPKIITIPDRNEIMSKNNIPLHPLFEKYGELIKEMTKWSTINSPAIRQVTGLNFEESKGLLYMLEREGILKKYGSFWRVTGQIRYAVKSLNKNNMQDRLLQKEIQIQAEKDTLIKPKGFTEVDMKKENLAKTLKKALENE